MHLQQTKRASATSGGPQYYFHDLSGVAKTFLRSKGAVAVALVTPYGATKSHFFAVSANHKLSSTLKPVPGRVGHDRIQQGTAAKSIGEDIREWYNLPAGQFERIDIDLDIDDDIFYIRPSRCKYASSNRTKVLKRVERPLTFTRDYMSPFWKEQLQLKGSKSPRLLEWSLKEIHRVVKVHLPATRLGHIQEPDLLRASGPLRHLGVKLGGYVGKGYDCKSQFQFIDFQTYRVPVEIKRNSHGFTYQQRKYGKDELSRAVILCAVHDHHSLHANIDVIELNAFSKYARDELRLTF